MFVININDVAGVDLLLKALRERCREKGCIASGDLADGIERTILYVDNETGVVFQRICEPEGTIPPTLTGNHSHLRLVKP